MDKIGIFFGTETGTTRLVAKKIHARLGEALAARPLNVNRTSAADFLQYDALILGTPSYGVGQMPGRSAGCLESNWEEFLALLGPADLSGKRIALFGLGAQERYAERFASSLRRLHDALQALGAELVGYWPVDGYTFQHSASVIEQHFVGLVIDQRTQGMQTDARIDAWLASVTPLLKARLAHAA
ncbi:flavodoxin [Viridibacterium curvum]|uniref:Flavodoxin n=1 Tax=Viridibacterium curvum TaxID=1101404 RepID=A0ABP9QHW7_9RHOO